MFLSFYGLLCRVCLVLLSCLLRFLLRVLAGSLLWLLGRLGIFLSSGKLFFGLFCG